MRAQRQKVLSVWSASRGAQVQEFERSIAIFPGLQSLVLAGQFLGQIRQCERASRRFTQPDSDSYTFLVGEQRLELLFLRNLSQSGSIQWFSGYGADGFGESRHGALSVDNPDSLPWNASDIGNELLKANQRCSVVLI